MVEQKDSLPLVAGIWQGVISDEAGEVVARIVEIQEESGRGLVVSAAHSGIQMPMGQLLVSERELEFTVPRLRALFVGTVQTETANIIGKWTQGGAIYDANFQREVGGLNEVVEIVGSGTAVDLKGVSDEFIGLSWLAHLEYPAGMSLPLILRLEVRANNVVGALVDSPRQGRMGIKVSRFEVNGADLCFEIEGLGASFIGTRSKRGDEIEGVWKQAGLCVALTWHRNSHNACGFSKD